MIDLSFVALVVATALFAIVLVEPVRNTYFNIRYRLRGIDESDSQILIKITMILNDMDDLGYIHHSYSKDLPKGRFNGKVDLIISDLESLKSEYANAYPERV
ncbi:hypothetical protein [Methanolobus sp. WCC4]|uniref:hypothetical protein n=1 Tax=Methanolobus sp. WCC4 TaxID=3125784 RepID=UPI0030FA7928